MAAEGEWPKADGDVLYGSEVSNNLRASPICGGMGNASNINSAVTHYGSLGGVKDSTSTTSTTHNITVPYAGTLRNFYVNIPGSSNSLNGNTIVTIVKNGTTTTGLTVTYGASATGNQSDTSNTHLLAAGDTLQVQIDTTASGSGNMGKMSWSVEYVEGAV
jgi:hypothetical protein